MKNFDCQRCIVQVKITYYIVFLNPSFSLPWLILTCVQLSSSHQNMTCSRHDNFMLNYNGRDRMVVGFTTTYAISAYHHWCCEFESRSWRGVQYYVIKFVSDLRQVSGFLRVLRFPPPIKLTTTI